jgi:hypothetical protein
MMMDLDYWIRAGLHAKFYRIREVISTFRFYEDCKTQRLSTTRGDELIRIYDKLYARTNLPLEVLKVKSRAYSFCYWAASHYSYQSGDRRKCWHYLLSSLRADWRHAGLRHLILILQNLLGRPASASVRNWLCHRRRILGPG